MRRISPDEPRAALSSAPLLVDLLFSLLQEVSLLLRTLREPMLIVALLCGLALWTLAYQVPFATVLHIGGDTQTHRREDDAPYLKGFNGSQPKVGSIDWWTLEPGYGYRWSSGTSTIALPGIGGGTWALAFDANSGRGDGSSVASVWTSHAQQFTVTIAPAAPTPRTYRVLIDADARGDLQLTMRTPTYDRRAAGDPRELGFVLSRVQVAPEAAGVRLPAFGQLGWLLLALTTVYLLARRLILTACESLALSLACATLLAVLLVQYRLVLTIFTPTLATLLIGCYGLAVVMLAAVDAFPAARCKARLLRTPPAAQVIALIVLAFALRLGGLLHPNTLINDIGLHANNLLGISSTPGNLYFTEGLPSDAGGGESPYPPGTYLLLAPFQLLFRPSMDGRLMLLKIGVALMDSLVVGLIWLVLWLAGAGRRAALLGAALYLAPPPLLASFSIGEFANIGGQALALPALAALAVGGRQEKADTRHETQDTRQETDRLSSLITHHSSHSTFIFHPSSFIFLSLLCIALLGHLGVAISLICVLLALWTLCAVGTLVRGGVWRANLIQLTWMGALAALAVGLFYYSAPIFAAIFAQRLSGGSTGASVIGMQPTLLRVFGPLVSIFTARSRLMPLLVVLGLLGLIVIIAPKAFKSTPKLKAQSSQLKTLLLAWWLGTLLSLGLLLVANQGVRWQHFLYPALCLGAGPALATLWRRGNAGRAVALAGTLAPICYGVAFWVAQLQDYLH